MDTSAGRRLHPAVDAVATAHGISAVQAMYAYVHSHGLSVLSSCFHPEEPAACARYYADDLKVYNGM